MTDHHADLRSELRAMLEVAEEEARDPHEAYWKGRASALAEVLELLGATEPTPPDPTPTEVKLARGVLAWKHLADHSIKGYGDPAKWQCYDWRGWKLDMNGSEAYFADEFTAQACKDACAAVHGLADDVVARASKAAG